ncbi:hypothetical protein TcasGA2_TC033586 [Tribolium castaneum]|uniref:Uncharacterized protein n=1 Tax=Tribolium castaneum TaxID=7070 RepID=A0A139WFB0_TRICA|nr:hypothetical protein TcasGA2_TC033586 [Tribolium castaneum]
MSVGSPFRGGQGSPRGSMPAVSRDLALGPPPTFEQRQRLQLHVLRVPVPGAALRLFRLLLERALGEGIDPIDERRGRHAGYSIWLGLRARHFTWTSTSNGTSPLRTHPPMTRCTPKARSRERKPSRRSGAASRTTTTNS